MFHPMEEPWRDVVACLWSTYHVPPRLLLYEHTRRECQIHFAMRNKHIVEVKAFSVGSPRDPPCLILERMEMSLYDYLSTCPPALTFGDGLNVIYDTCQVLGHTAHAMFTTASYLLKFEGAILPPSASQRLRYGDDTWQ